MAQNTSDLGSTKHFKAKHLLFSFELLDIHPQVCVAQWLRVLIQTVQVIPCSVQLSDGDPVALVITHEGLRLERVRFDLAHLLRVYWDAPVAAFTIVTLTSFAPASGSRILSLQDEISMCSMISVSQSERDLRLHIFSSAERMTWIEKLPAPSMLLDSSAANCTKKRSHFIGVVIVVIIVSRDVVCAGGSGDGF